MVSWKTKMKAYWLSKEGKVKKDLENDKRIFFTVETKNGEKSIIFDKKKEKWSCDCQFFSIFRTQSTLCQTVFLAQCR